MKILKNLRKFIIVGLKKVKNNMDDESGKHILNNNVNDVQNKNNKNNVNNISNMNNMNNINNNNIQKDSIGY